MNFTLSFYSEPISRARNFGYSEETIKKTNTIYYEHRLKTIGDRAPIFIREDLELFITSFKTDPIQDESISISKGIQTNLQNKTINNYVNLFKDNLNKYNIFILPYTIFSEDESLNEILKQKYDRFVVLRAN